jgi:predicted hydrocarbon binding protein
MTRERFLLSNRRTRIYLDALGDVMGRHGLSALLRVAGLTAWIYDPPPYDNVLEVDAVDFVVLNTTLEEIYGPRGARSLIFRTGKIVFAKSLEQMGAEMGLNPTALKLMPLDTRVKRLLEALARGNAQQGDIDALVTEEPGRLLYTLTRCPECWGRSGLSHSICEGMVGFIQAAIEWAGAVEHYWVKEIECGATKAVKDSTCVFAVNKAK